MSTFGAFHCLNVCSSALTFIFFVASFSFFLLTLPCSLFLSIAILSPFGEKLPSAWAFKGPHVKSPNIFANYSRFTWQNCCIQRQYQQGAVYVDDIHILTWCFSSNVVYRTVTKSFNRITMKIDRKKLFITTVFFMHHSFFVCGIPVDGRYIRFAFGTVFPFQQFFGDR